MVDRTALVPKSHSRPIGKYSPGVALMTSTASRWVFLSGQVAIDANGKVLGRNNPAEQAEFVFERLRRVLAEADGGLGDLVSLVIYLVDVKHFDAVSAVRNRILSDPAPASTLVVVSHLAESECLVEISGVAVLGRTE